MAWTSRKHKRRIEERSRRDLTKITGMLTSGEMRFTMIGRGYTPQGNLYITLKRTDGRNSEGKLLEDFLVIRKIRRGA